MENTDYTDFTTLLTIDFIKAYAITQTNSKGVPHKERS